MYVCVTVNSVLESTCVTEPRNWAKALFLVLYIGPDKPLLSQREICIHNLYTTRNIQVQYLHNNIDTQHSYPCPSSHSYTHMQYIHPQMGLNVCSSVVMLSFYGKGEVSSECNQRCLLLYVQDICRLCHHCLRGWDDRKADDLRSDTCNRDRLLL